MKRKIRYFYRSIPGSLLSGLGVTLILILALITGSGILMIQNMRQQIYQSNRNELEIYMEVLASSLDSAESDLNRVIADNWEEFRCIDRTDVANYADFVDDLKALRERNSRVTLVFYYTQNQVNDVWVGYEADDYSYQSGKTIGQQLAELNPCSMKGRNVYLITLDEQYYLGFWVNNYAETDSIGVLMSVDEFLQNSDSAGDEKQDYLIDREGRMYDGFQTVSEPEYGDFRFDEIVVSDGLVGISAGDAGMGLGIIRIMRDKDIIPAVKWSYLLLAFGAGFLILFFPFLWILIRSRVLAPLERLHLGMQQIEQDNIEYRMEEEEQTPEFEYSRQMFNSMAGEIQNLRIEKYEQEIEKLQIESANLRLQVSPHMLQNSLNMIYNLALSKNYKVIREFVLCLSGYFRYVLDNHRETVTLREELQFVDDYLKVQKIRFPEKFVYVYDVEEQLYDRRVPPLLIQNFVENTIKYGLRMDDEIEIIIIVKEEEGKLQISVVDTGIGMSSEVLSHLNSGEQYVDRNGTHIGIWNCRRRLRALYSESVLNISSEPDKGTQVWIEIPEMTRDMEQGERGQK